MLGPINKLSSGLTNFVFSVKLCPHPLLLMIKEHNQGGWENTLPFYILFQVLKILMKVYKI